MTDRHAEFLELCAALALGSIDAAERSRLEAHRAAGCPECERALRDFEEVAFALARSTEPARPDAGVKSRVLAEVAALPPSKTALTSGSRPATRQADAPSAPRAVAPGSSPAASRAQPGTQASVGKWPWWIGALGWGAAALLAALYFAESKRSRAFQTQVAGLETKARDLEVSLAEERGWVESMSSSEAKVATFAATKDAPALLEGWALFDPTTQRAVLVFENLQLPTDRDFELWAIRDAGPESLGLIHVDASGRAFLRLGEIGDAAKVGAFAVSLEAKGGSPTKNAPAGPVVMVGAL